MREKWSFCESIPELSDNKCTNDQFYSTIQLKKKNLGDSEKEDLEIYSFLIRRFLLIHDSALMSQRQLVKNMKFLKVLFLLKYI